MKVRRIIGNRILSAELGQIVGQEGEYKVLRIDNPEDIVKFLKINNIHSWDIEDIHYARLYAPIWFLYKNDEVIGVYAERDGRLLGRDASPIKDPEAVRIFKKIISKKITAERTFSDEEKEEMFNWLDALRESGQINMFGAFPYLAREFHISREEAKKIWGEWARTFRERHKI